MGFFRHALIGIGLYEGIKYLMKKDNAGIATNAKRATLVISTAYSDVQSIAPADDPWKNSLADDELRAPDS